MTCVCCSKRYELCKNIRIHNLLDFIHKDVINTEKNELEYFTKENLIYINNIDEIEVFDELIKDISKKYVNHTDFNKNIKNIIFDYSLGRI